jgi:hypothetical protein
MASAGAYGAHPLSNVATQCAFPFSNWSLLLLLLHILYALNICNFRNLHRRNLKSPHFSPNDLKIVLLPQIAKYPSKKSSSLNTQTILRESKW